MIQVDALLYDTDGALSAHDLFYRGLFVLEHFIDLKKVHHFVENVTGELRNVLIYVVGRFAERDGDDLFVLLAVVEHIDDADGITLHQRRRQNGFAAQHEHVERVAVVRERARNETVTCGIDGGRV